MPLVEQELLTLPEHMSSTPVFSGVRVTRSLVLYVMFCRSLFVHFLLIIVLSGLLRYTDSDCSFGIIKLVSHIAVFVNSRLVYFCVIFDKMAFISFTISLILPVSAGILSLFIFHLNYN